MTLNKQRTWQAVLTSMLLALAFVAFWPDPVDQPVQMQLEVVLYFLHQYGTPLWINYGFVEASANVALFAPLGFITKLAFPVRRWWQLGAFGMVVSACIEVGQLLFLHNRLASPLDLITNVSGCVIGILVANQLVNNLEVRDRWQRISGVGIS